MCFIGLAKACGAADRTRLWTVCPAKMIVSVRQFHGGMREYVRMNNSESPGWFGIRQGLRQGCMLAPVPFNILFSPPPWNTAKEKFLRDETVCSVTWCISRTRKRRGKSRTGHKEGNSAGPRLQREDRWLTSPARRRLEARGTSATTMGYDVRR